MLVAMVLGACLAMPQAGKAVLLVPVRGGALSASALQARHGLRVVGTGKFPGSLIVHTLHAVPVRELLGEGIVPVTAPGQLCRPGGDSASVRPNS